MPNKTKKLITLALFAVLMTAGLLWFKEISFAQGAAPNLGLEPVGSAIGLPSTDIRLVVARIIRTALGLLGIVALVLILYAGFVWMTAGGNDEKISQAKKILLNAVIGLAIIMSSYAIASFVINGLVGATTEDGAGGGPGGGGGDNPYFPAGIFYVDSLPQGGQLCVRNVHLAITFNKEVDISTLNGNVVAQTAAGAEQAGEWQLLSNTTAAFVPNGDCGSGTPDCYAPSTSYILRFKNASAVKTSDGQMSLNCAVKAGCADVQFTTGEGVDRNPPQVKIEPIAGDLLRVGSVVPVQVSYTDDNGVQKIDLSADSYFVGSQSIAGCQKTGSVTVNWPTAGIASGAHILGATGYDWSALNNSTSTNVNLLPQHCFDNALQADLGEIQAGPPACGGECGACAGGSCTNNTQCASGYCDPAAGVCVDKMRINGVSPLSGGPGTFVSISGNYFGNTPGKVFLGNTQAPLASCGVGAWKPWQIIMEVPVGAASGPISVETAPDAAGKKFTDATNDNFGPAISDFTVNNLTRPGLCSISPASDLPGAEVSLIGNRLGIAPGQVFFGAQNVPVSLSNWAATLVKARVPLLDAGPVGVKVAQNNLDSNSIRFFVEQGLSGTAPIISTISPNHGAKGEYITITGNNFGNQTGLVRFKENNNGQPGEAINGNFNFPTGCQSTWTDKQIIVKFPNSIGLANGPYFVQVVPANANQGQSPIGPIFNLENGEPAPGVCSIDPASGPVPFSAGAPGLQLTGEYFGPSPAVYFWSALASATSTTGRIQASSAVVGNLSFGQVITTQPPLGTQSGPVVVFRSSDNKISNPQNFSVLNCVTNNNTCTAPNTHCCVSGSEAGLCRPSTELCEGETLSAGYIWRFSTKDIPKIPRVVERCDSNTDLGLNIPTPSPSSKWDTSTSGVHHNVCRTASVMVEFSLPTINDISRANLLVNECQANTINEAGRTCTAAQTVDIGGVGDFIPQPSTENTSYLQLNLADSYNNGKWKDSTWYQIILKSGITAGVGTSSAPLARDMPCGDGTAYCFVFRADAQDCKMKQVVITPYSYFTSVLEEPMKRRVNPADAGEDVIYSGHGLSTQRCIVMNTDAFNWSWGTENSYYTDIFSTADDTAKVSSLANTVGVGLTNPDNAVNITSTASLASASYTGESPLTIDLNNPEVVDFWPTCLQSCTNAEVGVRFNTTMSNKNLPSGPVQLLKCNDENCFSTTPVLVPADVSLDSASDYRVLKIANSGVGSDVLEPNSIYQVILSASTTDVNSPDLLWSAAKFGDPTTHSKPYNKQFTWRFKTKTEKCKISRVDVTPDNFIAEFINDKELYNAQPYSSPDTCSAQGQKLNPWTVGWNWSSSVPNVASVASFSTKGNNPYCTSAGCVRKGSNIPASFTAAVPVCGNGVVEAGEDCDSPNKGAGCGLDCRRLGNVSTSTCGNGIIEPNLGETCDPGLAASAVGCNNICLRSGSAKSTGATATGASICGNGFVGSGEDCDLGIAASPTITASAALCSENCLHKGARLSNNWCFNNSITRGGFTSAEFDSACKKAISRCGDGVDNPDEDSGCDLGGGNKADWCNDFCLTSTSTHSECLAGSEGCDVNRQHIGSSLLYTIPSVCGDGAVGTGEDAFCETSLPNTHTGVNPWSLATGVGLGDASGVPPTQKTDISANTTEGTTGGAVGDKGQFTIPCGYKTDAECQVRMGSDWGVAANGCCYLHPKLLKVYPGNTSTAQSNVCPNTAIEATFDQEIDITSLQNNIILGRGIGGAHPTAPVLAGSFSATAGSAFNRIAVAGNYAYAAEGDAGLRIFDITTSSHPVEISLVNLRALLFDVKVAGGYAYVASVAFGAGSLHIINIANPHSPTVVSSLDLGTGFAVALQVAGNKVYIAAKAGGVKIVDIANKSAPVVVGTYSSPSLSDAFGITIRGALAYVANGANNNLQILNISNPAAPVFLGSSAVSGSGLAQEVALDGDYAYLADGYDGLKIIDISSSTNPVEVGAYAPAGSDARGVVAASGYVFLANGGRGLEILDPADPAHPALKGTFNSAPAQKIAVSGDRAYMVAGTNMSVVDISFLTVFNCTGAEDVTSLATITASDNYNNLPWYKKIFVAVVNFFKNLAGQDAAAVRTEIQSVKWCAGEDMGQADVVAVSSTLSKIVFKLSKPLALDTDYFVALKDGLRSKKGISIGKNNITGKPLSWKFITGEKICEIDKVSVNPAQVYLNKVGATADLTATAFNASAAQIQPIPGYYSWDYLWQPSVNPYVNLQATTSSVNTISAQNRSGEIDIRASAVITANTYTSQSGSVATGKSHAIVFLCENPWPPKDLYLGTAGPYVIFPYEDKVGNNDGYNLGAATFDNTPIAASPAGGYFNFRSYYCADAGSTGIADDLPYLRPAVQVSASIVSDTPTSSLKRFIFTNTKNNDAIGIQVFSNPKYLTVSQWFANDRLFGGQGFVGNMQTTKIDGYDALTDGNNIYVDALNYSDSSNNLYPNIYLFSINANAAPETKKVFEQMISNLRFNTNLTNYGYCGVNMANPGVSTTCQTDLDCEGGEVCSVQIDKLKRNYRRLRDLNDIESLLGL